MNTNSFINRHIGPDQLEINEMLTCLGYDSLEQFSSSVVPDSIAWKENKLNIPAFQNENELLEHMEGLMSKNKAIKSFIGQGYYGTFVPTVIRRNILENPGWYTAYTPYQAEISQGRLEALFIFQTMISEITGLPIANASLLDEGTAAAEAVLMLHKQINKKLRNQQKNVLFIDQHVFFNTKNIVLNRCKHLDIEIEIGNWADGAQRKEDVFAYLVQFPDARGKIQYFEKIKTENDAGIIVCADLLSMTIFEPIQAELVDVIVGTTQRFGVPMWYGGPHAAYFATQDQYKRVIPGRVIGQSIDQNENVAFRMALQTREQHIKREKATSNICTAQALLAIMAGMYAVHHGKEGLEAIAFDILSKTHIIAQSLIDSGYDVINDSYFDTVSVKISPAKAKSIKTLATDFGIELYILENEVRISVDETISHQDIVSLLSCFGLGENDITNKRLRIEDLSHRRTDEFLSQDYFTQYRSETKLMRFIKSLENKDFSLVHGMIPLGSCTMKLNGASQLLPLSWSSMTNYHPFANTQFVSGYQEMIENLADYLCQITGFSACSMMSNSGAQGELAGLLTMKNYQLANDERRNIILIPSSAHGTNPASAVLVGFDVRIVNCTERGDIDLEDLKSKASEYQENLAGVMITYPSTHGVFERDVKELCKIIHSCGGLVYMDGANMNAQVGLTSPGHIGADVCHLNLHKTFAIPHGGGGPGMGPICVNEKLAPYLPKQDYFKVLEKKENTAIASSQYGSAAILAISYAYIRLLGAKGLKTSTQVAILNANYLKTKLSTCFDILYTDPNGLVAHEFIIDLREFKEYGIEAEDVAKRLIDYGFHAPTLSFPVAGTLMIEPTESEDKGELDRFIESMLSIRREIQEIQDRKYSPDNNVLVNAPHTQRICTQDDWSFPYSREKAAYPLGIENSKTKFWASVGRVNNAHGDRNLVCVCPPLEVYQNI